MLTILSHLIFWPALFWNMIFWCTVIFSGIKPKLKDCIWFAGSLTVLFVPGIYLFGIF